VINDLVHGNWVRTLLWTANAFILLGVTGHIFFAAS